MNKLICCDCVEGLKTLPTGSIPLVITSPPWDDLRQYCGFDWDFKTTAEELHRVISPRGVCCWHVADQVSNGTESLTSFKQALYFRSIGFLVNTLVIDQHIPNRHLHRYGQTVQFVFVLSKGNPKVFHPIKDVPNASAGHVRPFNNRDVDGTQRYQYDPPPISDFRCRSAVWWISAGGHSDGDITRHHPAVFNERLVKDLMVSFSDAGQVVLDPFSGVGTVAVVALKEGRRYLGFEISPQYHALSLKRVARWSAKLAG